MPTNGSTKNASEVRDPFRSMSKPKRLPEKPKETTAILLGEHSRYQIKSGRLSGEYVARAFPKPPTNARGLIAEARGETEEAAIAALHAVIDAREIRRAEDRRIDQQTGLAVPSIEEYAEAIAQVSLSRPQSAMLTALALAEEDGLPEVRLASAAGYKSQASANRAFVSVGLLIANYLSMEAPPEGATSDHDGSTFLGYRGEQQNDEDPGNWILHAELREAVRTTR